MSAYFQRVVVRRPEGAAIIRSEDQQGRRVHTLAFQQRHQSADCRVDVANPREVHLAREVTTLEGTRLGRVLHEVLKFESIFGHLAGPMHYVRSPEEKERLEAAEEEEA